MITNRVMDVPAAAHGARLDRFLADRLPTSTRAAIVQAIEQRAIRVDGVHVPKNYKLKSGQHIEIQSLEEAADRRVIPQPELEVPVVYEDSVLLAFDKPAGMPVHPLASRETGTLANAMVAHWPETAEVGDQSLFPALIHRIDTGTSGLVLAARNTAAYTHLRAQFRRMEVEKTYLALVHGTVREAQTLDGHLEHTPHLPYCKMRIAADGNHTPNALHAITHYEIEPTPRPPHGFTLLRITIPTGVTHQIRCQLASIGHPVVGDRIYGQPRADTTAPGRHLLHAAHIAFDHPTTGRRIALSAPLPADMLAFLK